MTDNMILATSYKAGHRWPVQITEKLDGVASIFTVESATKVTAMSRQGKPLPSVTHIEEMLVRLLDGKAAVGTQILGELTVDGLSFKDAGGVIRREIEDERIVLNVYDYVPPASQGNWEYADRMQKAMDFLLNKLPKDHRGVVRYIPGGTASNPDDLAILIKAVFQQNPRAEGVMIRPWRGEHSMYRVGRSKGFMRLKAEPTVDLRVTGFEEAISKETGEGLKMVGRINCEYGDIPIGCGPGTLTHTERREIWRDQKAYIGRIAVVKYKPDDAYTALREPVFQGWHPDKTEPDAPVNFEIKVVDKRGK